MLARRGQTRLGYRQGHDKVICGTEYKYLLQSIIFHEDVHQDTNYDNNHERHSCCCIRAFIIIITSGTVKSIVLSKYPGDIRWGITADLSYLNVNQHTLMNNQLENKKNITSKGKTLSNDISH